MGHDQRWQAVVGDDGRLLDVLEQDTRFNGYQMDCDNLFEMPATDGIAQPREVIAQIHPHHGHMRCSLLHWRVVDSVCPWTQCGSFPVLAGAIPNQLRILRVTPGPHQMMGCIEAQTAAGRAVTFFEPMYWGNHNEYEPGADCVCSLAGLALELKRVSVNQTPECDSASGPHAGAPAQSRVSGDGGNGSDPMAEGSCLALSPAAALKPDACSDVMRCRTRVMGLEWFKFNEIRMCRMLVALAPHSGSDPVWFILYSSPAVLNGYAPVLGDEIEIQVWMQGYLTSLPLIDDPPQADSSDFSEEMAAEAFARAWNNTELRPLALLLDNHVQFDSPDMGEYRIGGEQVLGYLQETLDGFAGKRLSAYAEMGQWVVGQPGRHCVLLGINNPNRPNGVMVFEVAEGRIHRMLLRWGTFDSMAEATRRLGRYPK